MSTRSFIAIEKTAEKNYTYTGIYCHSDGYPEYNGEILVENYDNEKKVNFLISGGSLFQLHEHIYDCEYFTERGEPLYITKNVSYKSLVKEAKRLGCEYIYIFFPNEKTWQYGMIEDNFSSMHDIP
jgi:hypothetical protein